MVPNGSGLFGWRWLIGGALVASLTVGMGSPARLEAGAETPPSTDLVELGRRLFHDPAASASGRSACVSCHAPEHGFSDPAAFSLDEAGFTPRHSQPLTDLDLNRPMHWDGSAGTLEDAVAARVSPGGPRSSNAGYGRRGDFDGKSSAFVRIQSSQSRETLLPKERPTVDRDLGPNFVEVPPVLESGSVTVRFQRSQRYQNAFPGMQASDGNPSSGLVTRAIAAYVASLKSEPSAIDRVVAGEALVLTAAAERGLTLFRGRAGCAACHLLKAVDGRATLHDREFHNTGIAWLSEKHSPMSARNPKLGKPPPGLERLLLERGPIPDRAMPLKLDEVPASVLAPRDARKAVDPGETQGRFKTPSLRNVALRPPYMHDGSIGTLAEVVRHYASGCGDDPDLNRRLLKPFQADEQDVSDLVAFLEALSSPERPGLARLPWRERVERVRLTVVDAHGAPLAGIELEFVPAGETAAREAGGADATTRTRTDAQGLAQAPFGSRTHLRVRVAGGLRPVGGDLIPDTCREATLEMPVTGRARFTVVLEDGVEAPEELRAYRGAEGVRGRMLEAATAAALANGVVLFKGLEVVPVDPDPWILRRVALEERWPVGGPPGVPPDVEATYETLIPSTRTEAWVRFPGEAVARSLDLAKPTSLR